MCMSTLGQCNKQKQSCSYVLCGDYDTYLSYRHVHNLVTRYSGVEISKFMECETLHIHLVFFLHNIPLIADKKSKGWVELI